MISWVDVSHFYTFARFAFDLSPWFGLTRALSPPKKPGMTSIVFLPAGGTCDKQYPRRLGGYAFEFGDEAAVQRVLAELDLHATLQPSVERLVVPKDSQEMTDADREAFRSRIATASARERFVITHGTDTLVETAQFVHRAAQEAGCTVVLIGSRLPEAFKGSDFSFNLGFAIAAVQMLGPGAYVAMNGVAIPALKAARDESSGMWKQLP